MVERELRAEATNGRYHGRPGRRNTPTVKSRPAALPIDAIRIGRRFRREMGDLEALAASILELGLIHPPAVLADGTLVAGHRRLEACKLLGWRDVPVTVVELDNLLNAEWSENVMRLDFTRSEAVAIGRALEEHERAKAKGRQGTRTDQHPGELPESSTGETRDRVGKAVGMSGSTYTKAKAVVAAAEADPETFSPVVEEMDRTGKVEPAFQAVRASTTAIWPTDHPTKVAVLTAENIVRGILSATRPSPGAIASISGLSTPLPVAFVAEWVEQIEGNISVLKGLRDRLLTLANPS